MLTAAYQRASLSGGVLASSIVPGLGGNIPMKQQVNGEQAWTFGPFIEEVIILLPIGNGASPNGEEGG
ncbi:hypothetical protein Hypma_011857 [Hypsizygus marmoreus]|uniref:Uncharacterized protein n=1 Tax=Hypsizygus marmoreus TaxID=39966 RepID=A0A369JH01_HYPMA|nr:hypothetical protein Hypma_011857 [Hypsizygus marmoreus]